MAIFTMDPVIGILSCLFHSIISQERNGLQCSRSYLTWYLASVNHLINMLEIVQYVLALSEWQDLGMI